MAGMAAAAAVTMAATTTAVAVAADGFTGGFYGSPFIIDAFAY